MRASTASMILAFCAMLAVQATPSDFQYDSAGNEIERRGDFEYDAAGNEIEKRSNWEYDAAGNEIEKRGNWEYDAQGNEIEKRDPKKKAKKVSYFHYDFLFSREKQPKSFCWSRYFCPKSLDPERS
jgi:YD repeat-containing protein